MKEVMLTTKDNPFNPFDDFDNWFRYDLDHNYNCCGIVAARARVAEGLSDFDNSLAIERAINSIISEDVADVYTKVVREIASS